MRRIHGSSNVIATDIKEPSQELRDGGPFVQLDVLDFPKVQEVVRKNNVKQVYLLAALLSATA
ncbi:MAG TPA: NAD-dependent epimerase, partial [Bacteroidia bacterium]|nr:NAD-dependent epimerase [Bacteroidia bacterium]